MIRSLKGPDGYAPEVAVWLAALDESQADLMEILADLTHEELHRRLLPGAHSIAEILWHLANVELWWSQQVMMGQEINPDQLSRFGLTRPGELNCPPGHYEVAHFSGLMAEAHALTRTLVKGMDGEGFRSPTCIIPNRPTWLTPEWILFNLVDHLANHRGQIALLKRLYRSAQGAEEQAD